MGSSLKSPSSLERTWPIGLSNPTKKTNDLGGIHDVAGCVPTPISRPMPRKCHLKFAGCFTMQIRCKTMRPTGYLAMVVIIFGSANDTRRPGRSFKKLGHGRRARKRIGCGGESYVRKRGVLARKFRSAAKPQPKESEEPSPRAETVPALLGSDGGVAGIQVI